MYNGIRVSRWDDSLRKNMVDSRGINKTMPPLHAILPKTLFRGSSYNEHGRLDLFLLYLDLANVYKYLLILRPAGPLLGMHDVRIWKPFPTL